MKYQEQPLRFNLKAWRENYGLSVRKLAKVIGINYTYLSRIENSKHIVSFKKANMIFRKLGRWEKKNKHKLSRWGKLKNAK